jgi:hypothetical protein
MRSSEPDGTEVIAARHAGVCDDARIAAARMLVPLARLVRDQVKGQADAISRTERRFGPAEIRHLARLLDDLWMSSDALLADLEEAG